MKKIKIKQATKQGFAWLELGGVANLSFPKSKTRRGRVIEEGQICPTIQANETEIYRIEELSND